MSNWTELDEWKKRLDSMHMRDNIPRQKYKGEVYHWRGSQLMNEDKKPMTTPNYYRPGDPLDKLVPFLCPTCGGINDARQYTLLRVAMLVAIPCKKCECPLSLASAKKHNGHLDEDYKVEYGSEWDIRGVRIHASNPSVAGNDVFLVPRRALSLLEWLLQERDELVRLTKERE